VHDYGWGHIQHDFLVPFLPDGIGTVEWITTNPPFRLAVEFVERALDVADHGVAILVRSVLSSGLLGKLKDLTLADGRLDVSKIGHPMELAKRWAVEMKLSQEELLDRLLKHFEAKDNG
jgi:hypothetical protein